QQKRQAPYERLASCCFHQVRLTRIRAEEAGPVKSLWYEVQGLHVPAPFGHALGLRQPSHDGYESDGPESGLDERQERELRKHIDPKQPSGNEATQRRSEEPGEDRAQDCNAARSEGKAANAAG